MSLKDKDMDKLYSASAEDLSFDYNQGYWDEFADQLLGAQEADKPELSDVEIDSMYSASAAGLVFESKPEYWNEFSTSLRDFETDSNLSDSEIDGLYTTIAASLAIDYKPNYWNEFNASLPNVAPIESVLSDTEIDGLYAASTAGLAFDYKGDYWTDFNESFNGDVVLADTGIDEMYQNSSNDLSFDYRSSYWEEFKSRLRRKRRPDFLWFATAYSFVGIIGMMLFMNESYVNEPNKLVAETNKVENSNVNGRNSNSNKLNEAKNISNTSNDNTPSLVNDSKLTALNPEVNQNGNQRVHPVFGGVNSGGIVSVENPTNTEIDSVDPIIENSNNPIVVPSNPIDPTNVLVVTPETNGVNDLRTAVSSQNVEDNQLANEEVERTELPQLPVVQMPLTSLDNSPLAWSLSYLPKRPFLVGYFQGLGGLSQSLITPSDENSYSYGLGLGMELHHRNFTYTLGANGIIENHSDLILNRTAKVYGFGSDVYKFKIDYQQMYTLEGYFGVGYSLGKHTINLGVRPSFVLSTKVRIEEIGSSTTVFATDNNYNDSRSVYGFMDGIHRIGVKPTIGYSFNLTPTISLGGTVGVELMQSINEDFVNGMNNRLPFDGQIYFRKTFSFRR